MIGRLLVPLVTLAVLLIGCDVQKGTTNTTANPSRVMVTQTAKPTRIHITREEFGTAWPLLVDEGDIELIDEYFAVFHAGGKSYALNGAAQSKGYPEIDPIWAPNPSIPGAKKNIGVLIDKALSLK